MPATTEQKLKFVNDTLDTFRSIEGKFGISPKIAVAQAAHESNWGLSQLAIEGKNIFSITPGSAWIAANNEGSVGDDVPTWSALGRPVIYFPTTEYSKYPPEKIRYWEIKGDVVEKRPDGKGGAILTVNRYFRKYESWKESSWDWARKISKSTRYEIAYEISKRGDIDAYGVAMVKAGYATDPAYADGLVRVAAAVDNLGIV